MVDDALPAKKEIKITADSRYKLYINGKFVQEGPQKPLDQKEWFVDTANAAPYLVPGANVVAVEVLRFAASQNDSLYRTNTPCLYIEDCTADNPSFAGKKRLEMHHKPGGPAPIHAQENVYATEFFAGWKLPGCST